MWHEAIAKRGGNEVASCLYEHLKALPVDVKNITFWSDSCFGQNKNSFVALMFAMFVSTVDNIETIDHKFLVPGHTHMECDVDHSVIERKKKELLYKFIILATGTSSYEQWVSQRVFMFTKCCNPHLKISD